MATITRIDDRRFRQRIAAVHRQLGPGSVEFSAVVASEILKYRILAGPKDTNADVRGWQIAHNQLVPLSGGRVLPVVIFQLRQSRYARQNRHRLERQLRKWEQIVQNLERSLTYMRSKPGHQQWKSYRKAESNLRRAFRLRDVAAQQIARMDAPGGDTAIVIGGRKTQGFFTASSLTTVRTGFYGGEARVVSAGRQTGIEVRSKVPHAHIVERRTKILASAIAAGKSRGLAVGRSAYIGKLVAASRRVA